MTWEKDFTEAISSAALHAGNMPDNKQIISLIDLTLLNNNASLDELHALAAKAERYSVAAVCVLPKHLDDIPQEWQIKRATVINFPGGNQNRHDALLAVEAIIKSRKADEIDYVFPYSAYLNGEHDYALSCCHEQFKLCQANNVIFKVILEQAHFPIWNVFIKQV
ncbi:deoxyribose-phosphate aldolase [Legionella londiniensis]|uniref:hypothetical protein n=1 Tax=Legionella londiniensis TaxID=45068 RepID=UPI000E03BD62|nr:hypothetical protein [Legionella londiniensis]STX88224.1 deoxyribose-phosphate aldolase [Legionella londiniensis]